MGALCSCFRVSDRDDESVDSDENEQVQVRESSRVVASRNAQDNFTLFLQNLTNKCEAVLGRRAESMSWPYQGPSSSQPQFGSSGSSSSSSGSGSGVSFMRIAKGSNHSRIEPDPFCEEDTKKWNSEIHPIIPFDKVKSTFDTISEDAEDVCPICLEEYTIENPRIVTKCSHHYHLSCIYEWNERSETCPVCSKLMVFAEMD